MTVLRVAYDAVLVETAVLLAERGLDAVARARFRVERDRLYGGSDADERDARFEELHGRWFQRLGLDRPLHRALLGRPRLIAATAGCRVIPARSAGDEMADLGAAPSSRPGAPPAIHLRVRAETLVDRVRLEPFLERELEHVEDMLDPAFGYRSELPPATGPAHDTLHRERYRAVWSAVVDGRLCRRGRLGAASRELRRADFARVFPRLEGGPDPHFARFFDGERPTHDAIVAFVLHPPGGQDAGGPCRLCGFPAPALDSDGSCARCAEVLAARAAGA